MIDLLIEWRDARQAVFDLGTGWGDPAIAKAHTHLWKRLGHAEVALMAAACALPNGLPQAKPKQPTLTEREITVLRLASACDVGGLPLRWHTVREMMGEGGWSVLNDLKARGAMEHPGYNDWRITEKGRIAIALVNAKEAQP